jgi:hypothetical protein
MGILGFPAGLGAGACIAAMLLTNDGDAKAVRRLRQAKSLDRSARA